MLSTKIDEMASLLKKNKRMTFRSIARELDWEEESVEKIALIMEKAGFAKTNYSINIAQLPSITFIGTADKGQEEQAEKNTAKAMDQYEIRAKEGHIRGNVKISYSKEERAPVYFISLPQISPYCRSYLNFIKSEIAQKVPAANEEKEPEQVMKVFNQRHKLIYEIIKRDLNPDEDTVDMLTDMSINEMYGLGELEALVGDNMLEEIIINSSKMPVAVYQRKFGWMKTNITIKNEEEIENYAQQIARKVGRQISTLSPLLDAHLGSGDRVNATLSSISIYGNTITLRLFARDPWTITKFVKKENNAMSVEMAALLWQAMQYEMNVLVAGGTASGKTSALNCLIALIQPFQRIITIEDTRELMLPQYQWNWIPLVTRLPNPEGFGEVTMLDLLVNSLRMRPDRIVMGEIRRKKEAEVFFESMHTGHSVYSTIHADTGTQVVKRIMEPPIEIPAAEVEDLHLAVVQFRDRRKNIRRTLEIVEIVPGASGPEINRVFAWKARDDSFQALRPPNNYFDQLNLHTGMTEKEIIDDQKNKTTILKWMVEKNLESIDDIGKVMKFYYSDHDALTEAAKKGTPAEKVLI